MFTHLQFYYLHLSTDERKLFKQRVIELTGCSKSTFYTHLRSVPPLLVKELLSKETNIEASKLYEVVDTNTLLTTKTNNK